ncbi:hypothetical protein [Lonepinella koalarum]|uniref:hypothetical protein n=1 Tax=Lonepinella koalarum TaxID=53417 RepID=UPI003F6E04EB
MVILLLFFAFSSASGNNANVFFTAGVMVFVQMGDKHHYQAVFNACQGFKTLVHRLQFYAVW